jgi:hypothetical protein
MGESYLKGWPQAAPQSWRMTAVASSSEVAHVRSDTATAEEVSEILKSDGCVVIEGLVRAADLGEIRQAAKALIAGAPRGARDFDGHHTRRIYDPIARTRLLDDLVVDPLLVELIAAAIGPSQFGMTILSELEPGEVRQRLHRDSSIYPLAVEFGPVQVNSIWAIDEFTPENGATLVALGSHVVPGPSSAVQETDLTPVSMEPGSVLLYDGWLIHGAGANASTGSRLGLIIEYTARWLRPAENHGLATPPEIAATLSPELQEMLGFNQHSQYLGFIAGTPPQDWLRNQQRLAN